MPIRIMLRRSILLFIVALISAGVVSSAARTSAAPVAAAPASKPRPTATPTSIPTPTATPAPSCTATGSVTPSPNGADYSNSLNDVATISASDIWAVGDTYTTQYQTLVLHWDGTNWTRVSSPNVGPYGNALYRVTALAANDIWAVGEANNGGSTLTLHWDGVRWNVIASPNSDNLYNILLDVAAVSSDDIWAVGRSTYAIPVGEDEEYHDVALLMHWDGAHWSLVPSAQPNTSDNRRNGVTTLPDGTAWVVGSQDQSVPPYQATLIERYVCQ